ncbi:MAG: hypothetical protein GY764_05255, partial [Halieaceae bacterium]|nr:hypothetical protein [Halieaceae bacterium]
NQLVEATFDSLAKVIDPVTLAEQTAVEGTLDLDRGGYNIVNDINGIRTHESGAKFEPASMSLHDLRESIKQALHQDELALKESPAMTATEANIRYELMQRLLGPTLGRLINDLLDPLIQRTFNILYRAKQLDDIPEGLTIGEMDIEYTGPLPRAQKVETANSIRAFLLEIADMAEVYPDAVDIPNVDDALREIATLRGVPATSLNSKKDVKNTREGRAKAAQQRQGVIDAGEAGNAAQAMGAGADAMGVDKGQILKAVGKSVAGGA